MVKAHRLSGLFGSALLLVALLLQVLPHGNASAAQITTRSLTLQAGATDGGSKPGGTVHHLFQFTVPTGGNIGSIEFQYCTLAIGTCVTPAGLDTTGASLGSQNGATGFTITNTTNGAPYISRTTANVAGNTQLAYQLLSVVNPDGTDCPLAQQPACTFFVRITTYDDADLTGNVVDTGVVAAAVTREITLTGQMPESLVFCTGGTVSTTGGVPDCATATSGSVNFNQLFSPTDTATATSQMAASTNAGSGYIISVNGPTLTSGSNTISAMTSSTAGVHGVSQFGLNLKANTTSTSNPAVGAEIAPSSNGTNYRGQAYTNGGTDYGTVDHFQFNTGDTVANSGNATLGGTDAQIYTASYIVNVPGSQPAGTYTTTLTYICTPTF